MPKLNPYDIRYPITRPFLDTTPFDEYEVPETYRVYSPRDLQCSLSDAIQRCLQGFGMNAGVREMTMEHGYREGTTLHLKVALMPEAVAPKPKRRQSEEKQTMQDVNLFAAINPNIVAVEVTFPFEPSRSMSPSNDPSKRYTYKAPKEMRLRAGDKALVNTGTAESPVFKVVDVVTVHDDATSLEDRAYKWIIQRVDTALHDECVDHEKKFTHATRQLARENKREEIKSQLREKLGKDAANVLALETGVSLEPAKLSTDDKAQPAK